MIESFKSEMARKILAGIAPGKGFPADLVRVARRKLVMIDQARSPGDLAAPPANRLEALKGDRAGQHAIRINDQWRICFIWRDGHVHDVDIVDYH